MYSKKFLHASRVSAEFMIDKEKSIEVFKDAGWHFNNILTPEEISLKLKTFAHSEFATEQFSSISSIENNIMKVKVKAQNMGSLREAAEDFMSCVSVAKDILIK